MLVSTHRPTCFKDVKGQSLAKKILTSIAKSPDISPRSLVLAGGRGLGKCIAGDCWIKTPEGLRRIKSLVPSECKESEFVTCPKPVLVFNDSYEVKGYYDGYKNAFRVEFEDYRSITVSAQERFLCWTGQELRYCGLEEILDQQVMVDCTCIPGTSNISKNAEEEGVLSDISGGPSSSPISPEGISDSNPSFNDLFKVFGHNPDYLSSKKIPSELESCTFQLQRLYVRRLLSNVASTYLVELHKLYSRDVWNFILTVLELSGVLPKRVKDNLIFDSALLEFVETGLVSSISPHCYKYYLRDSDDLHLVGLLRTAVSIERLDEPIPLYDLSNSQVHCFVANGLVIHNTSSARIFAKAVNCQSKSGDCCNSCDVCNSIKGSSSPLYMELDSAIVGNVDVMREMRDSFSYTLSKGYRVIVFDECQLCSKASQSSLLKILEEAPKGIFFILSTTNPEQLLPTIISRSLVVPYATLTEDELKNHLLEVASRESIQMSPDTASFAARRVRGHVRDGVQQLELIRLVGEDSYISSIDLLDKDFEALFSLYKQGLNSEAKDLVSKIVLNPVSHIEQDFEVFIEKLSDKVFVEQTVNPGERELIMFWLRNHKFIKSSSDWYLFLLALGSLFEKPKQNVMVNRFSRT